MRKSCHQPGNPEQTEDETLVACCPITSQPESQKTRDQRQILEVREDSYLGSDPPNHHDLNIKGGETYSKKSAN